MDGSNPSSGGSPGGKSSGGNTGSGSGGTTSVPAGGGSTGSAGAPAGGGGGVGAVGSGGSSQTDATSGSGGAAASGGDSGSSGSGGAPAGDAAPMPPETPPTPGGPFDFGGVGQEPLVPLAYTAEPVPPLVAMECPEDPTQGYTEYKDSFVVQRPYDLPASARFSYDKGIYTAWVLPNDKSHATWSGTHSRTETRFSDIHTGEHIFAADVMVEPGSENVCIQQVKGAKGPLGTYLRVNGGTMHQLGGGDILSGIYGKWFNLKVAWDMPSGAGRIWINNCLKLTVHGSKNDLWYFKFGTYTCNSAKCTSHYKNIHLYQKGSTDTFNVKSPIR